MTTVVALAFVTLAEASIGIFVKLVDGAIPIATLNFYRVAFAALFIFGALLLTQRSALRFPRDNIRDILIVGFLIALQISLFNTAMSLAPVANVVIFWSVAPFFVFIFSSIFLKERPQPIYIPIFLIAFVGTLIAEPLSFTAAWTTEQLGNLIALSTGIVYAALVTYLRREGKTETRVDILWFMLAASIYLLPALFVFGPGQFLAESTRSLLGVSVPVGLWAICLGMLSTGVAYFGISIVLRKIDANIYALIDIIVSPVIAGILAFLIFAEIPSERTMLGGTVLLLSGALLSYLRTRELRILKKLPIPPVGPGGTGR